VPGLKISKFLLGVLFFTLNILIIAARETPAVVDAVIEDGETVYVIRYLEFDIDGRTRQFALVKYGEFKEGERIDGRENFEKYLARKRQLLINQRVLEDVTIECFLGEPEADGALPVKLLISVVDSWNVIALPYPQYDSNGGFSITLKARDYNFLGTMNALRLDLGYRQKDDDKVVTFSVDTDFPFQAAGLDWSVSLGNFFSYPIGESLYYQNVTGLSVDLPWKQTTFTAGFNHYLTFHEKISDETKYNYGYTEDYYAPYGSAEVYTYWKIPFGIEIGDFGELSYRPRVSGRVNYPYGKMDEARKPVTTLSHSIGFGRIDWIENYQKGLTGSLDNSFEWYFNRKDAPLRITLDGNAAFYWPLSGYIGISTRLKYQQWWQWSYLKDEWLPASSVGGVIRGVLDDSIRAYRMLSLNFDVPVRVLRFWPSEWFDNPKLRVFNFEMHFAPFSDFAVLEGPYSKLKDDVNEGHEFRLDDMIYTGGFEVRVFPDFFRSLKIRGSVGYNLKNKTDGFPELRWGFFPQWDEIYIGMDFFY
jgi:outer membrane protein assembly factor BamA